MEDRYTQKIPQSLKNATEALLVHMPDPTLSLRIAETTLQRGESITVGRQAGMVDLLINEGSISRRHAEFRFVQDHYELRDFASLNGTFINDRKIEPDKAYTLKPNDIIRFGNIVRLRFLVRILDIAASSRIEVDTGPLPPLRPSSTGFLQETPEPPVAVPQEVTTTLSLTSRLSSVKAGSDTEKSIPLTMIDALKDNPGLVVMPEKGSNRESSPRIVLLQPGKRVMLGREEGNDLILDDMDVSRRHAEIFPAPTGVYIRDNDSSNGVFINKSRIDKPYRLSHGDRIRLGKTLIFFVDLQAGREQTVMLATPSAQAQSPQVDRPARVPVEVEAVARTEKKRARGSDNREQARKQQNGLHAGMKTCPQCGTPNMPTARFCARCSAPLFNAQ